MVRLIISLFFLHFSLTHASESKNSSHLLSSLSKVVGEYRGEIRLQTSDGSMDKLLTRDARLTLGSSGDELTVYSSVDLLGKGCKSKLIGIRELVQFAPQQSEVLRAVFDFDPGLCHSSKFPKHASSLLILVRKDENHGLALETLLLQGPASLDFRPQANKKPFVHGYFQRLNPTHTASNS
jgi:hypothetical protein